MSNKQSKFNFFPKKFIFICIFLFLSVKINPVFCSTINLHYVYALMMHHTMIVLINFQKLCILSSYLMKKVVCELLD